MSGLVSALCFLRCAWAFLPTNIRPGIAMTHLPVHSLRILFGLLVLSTALLLAQEPAGKQPEPTAAQQEETQKVISQLYKKDFDGAKTGEQKLSLARQLQ